MPPKKKVITAIEAEAERLGAVEVLFQRVAQGEAGDEANDPCGKTDQIAENAVMRVNVVRKRDEDGPRTAEVEHDQHGRSDVKHQSFAGRLNPICPGRDDQVPDDDEKAAGEEAEEEFEPPVQIGRVGVGDAGRLRIG